MTARFSRQAIAQIAEIIEVIADNDPATASAFARRVERLAGLIARYPAIGRQTSLAAVRVFPAKPYPYLIFYKPLPVGRGAVILRVRHMARAEDWRRGS